MVKRFIQNQVLDPDWGWAYRPNRAVDIDMLYLIRIRFYDNTVLLKMGRTFKTLKERFGSDPLVESWAVVGI